MMHLEVFLSDKLERCFKGIGAQTFVQAMERNPMLLEITDLSLLLEIDVLKNDRY